MISHNGLNRTSNPWEYIVISNSDNPEMQIWKSKYNPTMKQIGTFLQSKLFIGMMPESNCIVPDVFQKNAC